MQSHHSHAAAEAERLPGSPPSLPFSSLLFRGGRPRRKGCPFLLLQTSRGLFLTSRISWSAVSTPCKVINISLTDMTATATLAPPPAPHGKLFRDRSSALPLPAAKEKGPSTLRSHSQGRPGKETVPLDRKQPGQKREPQAEPRCMRWLYKHKHKHKPYGNGFCYKLSRFCFKVDQIFKFIPSQQPSESKNSECVCVYILRFSWVILSMETTS